VSVTDSEGTAYGAVGSSKSVDVPFTVAVAANEDTRGILPVSNKLRVAKAMSASPKDRDR